MIWFFVLAFMCGFWSGVVVMWVYMTDQQRRDRALLRSTFEHQRQAREALGRIQRKRL